MVIVSLLAYWVVGCHTVVIDVYGYVIVLSKVMTLVDADHTEPCKSELFSFKGHKRVRVALLILC